MTSDRVGVYADLPVDIVHILDEEASKTDKSKWEILAESLELYFGIDPTDDPDALERAICRLREDMNDIESSIDELTDQLERKRSQVQMLESKREDIIADRDSYVDLLDDLLDQLARNDFRAIALTNHGLKDAARSKFGRPTESNIQKVIDDMRDRAAATDREIAPWKWDPSLPKSGNRNPVTAAADGGTTDVGGRR
jgi:chromosome segregation ATPase